MKGKPGTLVLIQWLLGLLAGGAIIDALRIANDSEASMKALALALSGVAGAIWVIVSIQWPGRNTWSTAVIVIGLLAIDALRRLVGIVQDGNPGRIIGAVVVTLLYVYSALALLVDANVAGHLKPQERTADEGATDPR